MPIFIFLYESGLYLQHGRCGRASFGRRKSWRRPLSKESGRSDEDKYFIGNGSGSYKTTEQDHKNGGRSPHGADVYSCSSKALSLILEAEAFLALARFLTLFWIIASTRAEVSLTGNRGSVRYHLARKVPNLEKTQQSGISSLLYRCVCQRSLFHPMARAVPWLSVRSTWRQGIFSPALLCREARDERCPRGFDQSPLKSGLVPGWRPCCLDWLLRWGSASAPTYLALSRSIPVDGLRLEFHEHQYRRLFAPVYRHRPGTGAGPGD